jgi:hypothetical protein
MEQTCETVCQKHHEKEFAGKASEHKHRQRSTNFSLV